MAKIIRTGSVSGTAIYTVPANRTLYVTTATVAVSQTLAAAQHVVINDSADAANLAYIEGPDTVTQRSVNYEGYPLPAGTTITPSVGGAGFTFVATIEGDLI